MCTIYYKICLLYTLSYKAMDCTRNQNAMKCEEKSVNDTNGPGILHKMGSEFHVRVRAEQPVITLDKCVCPLRKWSRTCRCSMSH